jgi:hypothetical protein
MFTARLELRYEEGTRLTPFTVDPLYSSRDFPHQWDAVLSHGLTPVISELVTASFMQGPEWGNSENSLKTGSIEIGGKYGISRVWRQKGEQYEEDCRGATKKNRSTVMCWGMIKWGYKVNALPMSVTLLKC